MDELENPRLTQQSLWKAGPAFTQRCWLNNVKLLKLEVTPYIKKRMITQIAPTANTMNELYVQQPPGSRQLSIFIHVDHKIQSY